jgi:hypothetical protein
MSGGEEARCNDLKSPPFGPPKIKGFRYLHELVYYIGCADPAAAVPERLLNSGRC